jgi:gliding motility-associated lipoprotein GldH
MKKSLRTIALMLLGFPLLYACDNTRVFEQNKDIQNHAWHKDSTLHFQVNISDADMPYHIYYNVRNSVSYPAQNIYLHIEIQDSTGRTLSSDLNNIELFDPKTGKPYGDGLGDIFDHRVRVLENFQFPYAGPYQIDVEHRMRDKIMVDNRLPHIMSVGVRIEKAVEE